MTDPEIWRLAEPHATNGGHWRFTAAGVAMLGRAIEAQTRKECAAICDALTTAIDGAGKPYRREATASQCASAIRDRSHSSHADG